MYLILRNFLSGVGVVASRQGCLLRWQYPKWALAQASAAPLPVMYLAGTSGEQPRAWLLAEQLLPLGFGRTRIWCAWLLGHEPVDGSALSASFFLYAPLPFK